MVALRGLGVIPEGGNILQQNARLAAQNERLAAQNRAIAQRGVITAADRRQIFDNLLEKYGVEPAEELLKMLADPADPHYVNDIEMRAKLWQDLMQYRMPKLKSIEVSGQVEHKVNVVIVRYGEDGSVRQEKLTEARRAPVLDVKTEKF